MVQNTELLDFTEKTVIVTGGAKGIGYGISYRFAEAGAHVFIVDVDTEAATSASKQLQRNGWSAEPHKADVSDESDVQKMLERAKELYNKIDIVINNAGIYPAMPISSLSPKLFNKVMGVNLLGVFLITKYAAEIMKEQNGGTIINITSIDALHPSMVGLAHYDASKHGAWGFTKNAALELAAHNIRVNAIAPGGIITPGVEALQADNPNTDNESAVQAFLSKIPMHRMGEPDEIGKVALFLASDMASYITGEQIVVDGGALLA